MQRAQAPAAAQGQLISAATEHRGDQVPHTNLLQQQMQQEQREISKRWQDRKIVNLDVRTGGMEMSKTPRAVGSCNSLEGNWCWNEDERQNLREEGSEEAPERNWNGCKDLRPGDNIEQHHRQLLEKGS